MGENFTIYLARKAMFVEPFNPPPYSTRVLVLTEHIRIVSLRIAHTIFECYES